MRKYTFSALASVYAKEQAEYLNDALESLFKQTCPATEVVLVHDGELTQDLYNCINKWKRKLPIVEVKLQKNQGLGVALNEGLKHCRYELVARFDTDDINHPQRFEEQLIAFQSDPELALLSADVEEFNHEVGDINSVRVLPKTNAEIRKLAKSRNPFNHMAIMFKKTEVLLAGGYMHLHYLEDYYLWLRLLANQNKAQNLPNILVSARIGNGMHERRRGFSYLKSEYQLLKIKKTLNITGYLDGFYFFCLRGVSRLLPTNLLRIAYKLLRN
jgi:amylovoran biosynthesis glycosyltransferase AmsE